MHASIVLKFCLLWQRITLAEILQDQWFKKGYKPPQFEQEEDVNLEDIDVAFNDSKQVLS